MKNIKNVIQNIPQEDFLNKKVDLHIHTSLSDGKANYHNILQSAKEKNYKLIAITDHNTVEAHKQVIDEILITGVEFDCWFKGVFIHLLAYGVNITDRELEPFLAKTKEETESVILRLFSTRNVSKLINAIHNAGGIAILAHPACYWAINLEKFIKNLMNVGLDGIETYYPYPRFRSIVKFHSAKDVIKIAKKYPDLIKTGGSDFHGEKF